MNFRKIDLFVFSILSIACEFLSSFFFKRLDSGFYLSFSVLLFLISSLRWGIYGVIPFVLSGLPLVYLDNIGYLNGVIYYMGANIFAIIPMVIFHLFIKKDRDRNWIISSPYRLILYSIFSLLSLSIGKGIALFIINRDLTAILGYFVSNIFTFIITTIVLFILTKFKNSLVSDMDVYNNENKEVL